MSMDIVVVDPVDLFGDFTGEFLSTDFDVDVPVAPTSAVAMPAPKSLDLERFDWWKTIESQYANSLVLIAILEKLAERIDPLDNLQAFYNEIWDIDTAGSHGLDVWGRIVGVVRSLRVASTPFFGFAEAQPDVAWFAEGEGGAFYNGVGLTDTVLLADSAFRQLILAKAAANISGASVPEINAVLRMLFPGRGNCYVTEGYRGDQYFGFAEAKDAEGFDQATFYSGQPISRMQMTYTFEFPLTALELAIVSQSGVLPKPTGVSAKIIIKG